MAAPLNLPAEVIKKSWRIRPSGSRRGDKSVAENDRHGINEEIEEEGGQEDFFVSADPALIDRDFINAAFATEDMYWAKPLSAATLETMLAQSITLGLYKVTTPMDTTKGTDSDPPSVPRTPSPTIREIPERILTEQVGVARLVTDYVTLAYLTDVYIHPAQRAKGFGKWLVLCCKEIIAELPALRRVMLLATEANLPFYERYLQCRDSRDEGLLVMTRWGQWE